MELRAATRARRARPELLDRCRGQPQRCRNWTDRLGWESSEIISPLFFKGIIATVTQDLDLSTIRNGLDESECRSWKDDSRRRQEDRFEMIGESDKAALDFRRPPVSP